MKSSVLVFDALLTFELVSLWRIGAHTRCGHADYFLRLLLFDTPMGCVLFRDSGNPTQTSYSARDGGTQILHHGKDSMMRAMELKWKIPLWIWDFSMAAVLLIVC